MNSNRTGIVIILLIALLSCNKSDILHKKDNCESPIANAGEDPSGDIDPIVYLYANDLKTGETAKWEILTGTGGTINNLSSTQSYFEGQYGEKYSLLLTVTNSCGKSNSDTLNIDLRCKNPKANAGPDQLNIDGRVAYIDGALASGEYGIWAIAKGQGGKIKFIDLHFTQFTGAYGNSYILTWTVTNQCGYTSVDSVTVSFKNPFTYGSVKDINGNTYKTIKIGSQEWMAENLKTTRFNDGTSIHLITSNTEQSYQYMAPDYCWYDDSISNKAINGALYNWLAVETGKLCPVGWHVPSEDEWYTLSRYVDPQSQLDYDMSTISGKALKSQSNWEFGGGDDTYGFAGIGSGYRDSGYNPGDGEYKYKLGLAQWWTSSVLPGYGGRYVHIDSNDDGLYMNYSTTLNGNSIRCLKD